VGLIFGGGRFTPSDVNHTALFFALYTISLFAWSAQAIYARAFYAAGITWLPMLASTVILFAAFPLYGLGYRLGGAGGLAAASDVGILLQAVMLALLLHQRRMVSLASLDFTEMARCLLAAVVSGGAVELLAMAIGSAFAHLHGAHVPARAVDLAVLIAGTALWLLLLKVILEKTGSALPRVAIQRLGLG
jgi:putative peptidoglycan lipid II flippase